jgi:PmbA protein
MKKLMEQVLNHVTDHKAQGDLVFTSSKSLKMSAQKGALSTYNVSGTQILGLRLIKNDRVGLSYTESLDEESLKLMVKQALDNAEATEPNPHEKILNLSGELTDEVTFAEEAVDLNLKIERALELESKVRALDSRVTSVPYNSYSEQDYRSHYLSSTGRFTTYADKSYSITSSAVMDEKGKKSSYYDYHMAHVFGELNFQKVIDTAYLHARNLLAEQTLASGKYSVRFSEDCLKDLLSCFGNIFSAKASMDKLNPWADRLGHEVISSDLSISDHPAFERSFRQSRFDSEGVERRLLTLVENGNLKSFYHNSVTAHYFKTQTTGHASRSASGPLGVAGTDLIISGKNIKPTPAKYLEVIQMDGLYSGANRVSGNFSVAIKGYLWEGGEQKGTFGNITLSGNLFDLFNRVEVTGTELLTSTDESFFTVPLMFHDISIAGS